jgi:DNA-binding NarL/FixJ family response regulator
MPSKTGWVLVGRAGELDHLDRVLADLMRGRGQVLRVVGDPGCGRTAFLDAAVRRAARRGARVARMRAVVESQDISLALVRDLLRVLDVPASTATGGTDALVAAVVAATDQRPLLLAVDDVQDADPASARAVAAAAGRTADRPVTVVVTERTPVTRCCVAPDSWPMLRLEPLADDAARAVVRAVLGPGGSESVVAAVVDLVGGTPGALVAAASSLTPAQARGVLTLPAVLPVGATVEGAWGRVLDALPPQAREALLVLAVVGPDHPDLLAATLAQRGLRGSALIAAEARGLVHCPGPGRVEMRDRVLRAVVLTRADADSIRRVHGLAAEVGVSAGVEPAEIARHLVHSTALPDADVAAALEAQARFCAARGQAGDAALALEGAARLTPDPGLRQARAMAAVRGRIETGVEGTGARELLELVGPGPLPPGDDGWVRWLHVLAQPDLPGQLEAALAGASAARRSSDHGVLRALLWEAAETAWLLGRAELGLAVAAEYAQHDRAGSPSDRQEPAWVADALLAAALSQVGRLSEARELRRDALGHADELDPDTCPLPMLLDAVALDDMLLADTPGSATRLARAAVRAPAEGYGPQACLWGIRAWRDRAEGSWQSALRRTDEGLALSLRTHAPVTVCGLLALSVELAALRGDTARLADDATSLRSLAGRLGDARRSCTLERSLGLDALGRGDLGGALAHLQEAADVLFLGRGLRDGVLSARVDLVEVLVRLGDRPQARDRAGAVAGLLEQMEQPLASAWAARVGALTADDGEADERFEQALQSHAAGGDPFEHGRTALLYGEHLRRTRRRAEARRHLAHAEVVFTRLGARPWQRRAAEELRVAGGPAAATSSAPLAALTSQERNVARAVAQGRSTREVAELLVVSPRTVESHLTRIYRKLGVRGRTALAAALASRSEPSS